LLDSDERRRDLPKYLHTMIRVADIDRTVAFFELLGLKEV
jgi:lactoylglutathione lyase